MHISRSMAVRILLIMLILFAVALSVHSLISTDTEYYQFDESWQSTSYDELEFDVMTNWERDETNEDGEKNDHIDRYVQDAGDGSVEYSFEITDDLAIYADEMIYNSTPQKIELTPESVAKASIRAWTDTKKDTAVFEKAELIDEKEWANEELSGYEYSAILGYNDDSSEELGNNHFLYVKKNDKIYEINFVYYGNGTEETERVYEYFKETIH